MALGWATCSMSIPCNALWQVSFLMHACIDLLMQFPGQVASVFPRNVHTHFSSCIFPVINIMTKTQTRSVLSHNMQVTYNSFTGLLLNLGLSISQKCEGLIKKSRGKPIKYLCCSFPNILAFTVSHLLYLFVFDSQHSRLSYTRSLPKLSLLLPIVTLYSWSLLSLCKKKPHLFQ